MKKIIIGVLLGLLVLSGCATPSEAAARGDQYIAQEAEELARQQGYYDAAVRDKAASIASAEEWNVHVLGIPASGWVAIIVFALILGTGLLVGLGIWLNHRRGIAREDRIDQEKRAHQERLAQVESERQQKLAVIKRGTCSVCGADGDTQAKFATSTSRKEDS